MGLQDRPLFEDIIVTSQIEAAQKLEELSRNRSLPDVCFKFESFLDIFLHIAVELAHFAYDLQAVFPTYLSE